MWFLKKISGAGSCGWVLYSGTGLPDQKTASMFFRGNYIGDQFEGSKKKSEPAAKSGCLISLRTKLTNPKGFGAQYLITN